MPQIADDIVIDAEFLRTDPPLSSEERQQLEETLSSTAELATRWSCGPDGTLRC
jgi:hypothetical protein